MERTWVLSAPGGPHVGHMNLAIWVSTEEATSHYWNQYMMTQFTDAYIHMSPLTRPRVNSLAQGKKWRSSQNKIFKYACVIDVINISKDLGHKCVTGILLGPYIHYIYIHLSKMAISNHYMNQCLPRTKRVWMYCVIRRQWVNPLGPLYTGFTLIWIRNHYKMRMKLRIHS